MKKNIMIIDDSALMRRVLSDIINKTDKYQVKYVAPDGEQGFHIIQNNSDIDFIFLDINMPKMGGIDVLKAMKQKKIDINVVVFSTIAERSSNETIEALSLGAFDFLKKPENLLVNITEFRGLVLQLLEAGTERQEQLYMKPNSSPQIVENVPAVNKPKFDSGNGKLIAIACSTGGPKALQEVIPYFPPDLEAPVLIVQHMPEGFTKSLANRLNEMSQVIVTEAVDETPLVNGRAYIARGGSHLRIVESASGMRQIRITHEPPVSGLRPYANYMYESLQNTSFREIICVVLTGMGADGTKGIQQLSKSNNVYIISQDMESSTVYGMPRAIAQTGLVDEVVSLKNIARAIINQTGVR